MRFVVALVAVLIATGCGAGADKTPNPSRTPASDPTLLVDDCQHGHVRPRSMTVFCADAGVAIGAIAWRTWGRDRAVGVATHVSAKNGCCSSHSYGPAQIVAYSARPYRNGRLAFACMTVSPGLKPGHKRSVLWLSAATWNYRHLDDAHAAGRPCR